MPARSDADSPAKPVADSRQSLSAIPKGSWSTAELRNGPLRWKLTDSIGPRTPVRDMPNLPFDAIAAGRYRDLPLEGKF
jgi:hypothetical protein